MLHSDQL